MTEATTRREHVGGDVRAARRAVLAIFFVNGGLVASWVTYIPSIKERFSLSEAALGLTLLAVAAGSLLSLALVGGLIARLGSRLVTMVATAACCVTLPPLVLAPAFPVLVLSLLLFGMFVAAMDVAMNAQAVAVEERYERPIMSTFHALFSTGGLAGAVVAALLLRWGIGAWTHMLGAALILGAVATLALPHLLPSGVDKASDEPVFVRPSGPLLSLGLLAFFAMVSEGAMADWSAVYLRTSLGADAGLAATGYAAFSLAMAAGRFAGDALRARVHEVQLVRMSGLLAALGLGAALLVAHPAAVLLGFGCVGLGLANIVPVLFSAAGRAPGMGAGSALAAVATAGYFGFLAGPPLIGFVAEATTLAAGLGVVVVFTALVALRAGSVGLADVQAGDAGSAGTTV